MYGNTVYELLKGDIVNLLGTSEDVFIPGMHTLDQSLNPRSKSLKT